MPTYSYACTECDNKFDAVQAFTDDALTVCPQCSGRLRKLFNSVGVVFKGSGFYRTDSRDSGSSAGAEKSSSATPSEKSPGEKSTGEKSTGEKSPASSSSSGASDKSSSTTTPAAASS